MSKPTDDLRDAIKEALRVAETAECPSYDVLADAAILDLAQLIIKEPVIETPEPAP